MTEPLTLEEARAKADRLADDIAWQRRSGDANVRPGDVRMEATLRAYADQSERLKEIEEAVGEWVEADKAVLALPTNVSVDDEARALDRREAAEARLRALQEK